LADTTGDFVKEQLQAVADEIQGGMTEQMSIRSKLMRVHDVFFHPETGFSSNMSNYYDYRNSLLTVSLDRRKAIPMTLALLYKFICRRVGIAVEVVGLPGHIVAHVPALDTFVDVFDGGRLLTAADCARIVASFGFPFQASYLNPLPPELIVQRILNNLENCLVRQPTVQAPMAVRQRAAISALRVITIDPREGQIEEIGQSQILPWVTEACVGTDVADW
jgi:regulator of sirC expression with transglutaminase-like and TPR domain